MYKDRFNWLFCDLSVNVYVSLISKEKFLCSNQFTDFGVVLENGDEIKSRI